MPALAELERGVAAGARGPGLPRASSTGCCATSAGARRRCTARGGSSERAGAPVYLKREDLNHTGSHKLNNALGQALLAQADGQARGSSPRPAPASTAWRRRRSARCWGSSASSTWACEDTRRQRPNVQRMELLGRDGRAGRRRGADAQGGDLGGDPRLGRRTSESTHYVIGSVVGPAPYPALVRDLQRVIGDEARAQMLEREGRLPGARGRLRRRRLERDRHLHRVHRRRAGRAGRRRGGGRGDRHPAPRRAADRRRARPASCTARARR